jgi:hypothetical protein
MIKKKRAVDSAVRAQSVRALKEAREEAELEAKERQHFELLEHHIDKYIKKRSAQGYFHAGFTVLGTEGFQEGSQGHPRAWLRALMEKYRKEGYWFEEWKIEEWTEPDSTIYYTNIRWDAEPPPATENLPAFHGRRP